MLAVSKAMGARTWAGGMTSVGTAVGPVRQHRRVARSSRPYYRLENCFSSSFAIGKGWLRDVAAAR